ncbi:MAG: citramalate synthase [Candidatus Ancillula sp.]|jgi:2-isopropylmalate synthase|nr:citramalate synthase [Candidatus Ancillula sp.]
MKIEVLDTTLRDGAQQRGVNFSLADKKAVLKLLKDYGMDLIEGGWPGAIPKDTELFDEVQDNQLSAFGATRKAGHTVAEDSGLQALLNSGAKVVTVVAKSDIRHIERALKTSVGENLCMVRDTVQALVQNGQRAIVDAEHFFDGYKYNSEVSLNVVAEAFLAGADTVVLCDTNGGMLPDDITKIVKETIDYLSDHNIDYKLGIHAHNDTGCAVANTIAAVQAGCCHIQGTINEFGERTGNANLLAVIADLELKLGYECVPDLKKSYDLAHNIAEIANVNIDTRQPYVGDVAFAHKAGLHASALKVDNDLYQHIDPKTVGNDISMIVSEMAGRSSIEMKVAELGFSEISSDLITELTNSVKDLELQGYAFDSADASFELMLLEKIGKRSKFFTVESWRIISERQGQRGTEAVSEATVKLRAGANGEGERVIQTGEGNGPVNALDAALRQAIIDIYPSISTMELTDYRVRLLDTAHGTDSTTRVLITCYDSELNRSWTTIGVGGNIVEASWEALTDCYVYGLIKHS